MASLALLLKQDGYFVFGEDVSDFISTQEELEKENISILPLNSFPNIDADFFIVGHAFEDTKKILEEQKKKYTFYNRFLQSYLKKEPVISIAGSHGKTTCVGLIAHLLDASFLRGDGHAKRRKSKYFFLESCEYKNHYFAYSPKEIILLNVDYDHVDFFKSREEYEESFRIFLKKATSVYLPYKEKHLLSPFHHAITFGEEDEATYSYKNISMNEKNLNFSIFYQGKEVERIHTILKGKQFIPLLTVCYAFCKEHLEIFPTDKMDTFSLASRRFNIEKVENQILIDDYAHHPNQIRLHYENLCYLYKKRKKIAIFEGDRYSRVFALKKDFEKVLSLFDEVYLFPLAKMQENEGKDDRILHIKNAKYILSIKEILSRWDFQKEYVFSFMSSKEMKKEKDILKNAIQKK